MQVGTANEFSSYAGRPKDKENFQLFQSIVNQNMDKGKDAAFDMAHVQMEKVIAQQDASSQYMSDEGWEAMDRSRAAQSGQSKGIRPNMTGPADAMTAATQFRAGHNPSPSQPMMAEASEDTGYDSRLDRVQATEPTTGWERNIAEMPGGQVPEKFSTKETSEEDRRRQAALEIQHLMEGGGKIDINALAEMLSQKPAVEAPVADPAPNIWEEQHAAKDDNVETGFPMDIGLQLMKAIQHDVWSKGLW